MSESISDLPTSKSRLKIPRSLVNASIAAAMAIGIFSGDESPSQPLQAANPVVDLNSQHDAVNNPLSTAETRDDVQVSEIDPRNEVALFSPAEPLDTDTLLDKLMHDQLYRSHPEGTSNLPRHRAAQDLLGTKDEIDDNPTQYENPEAPIVIHVATHENKKILSKILSLIPSSVYKAPNTELLNKPLIHIVTGPTPVNIPGYVPTHKNTAPFSGYCECRQDDFTDKLGLLPSIFIDQNLVADTSATAESEEGAWTVVHELNHIRIISETTYSKEGGGRFTNPLMIRALQTLGFDVPENYEFDYIFPSLSDQLVASGDMEIVTDNEGNKIYNWKSRTGYLGKNVGEMIPRSVDMYFHGKEYFMAEFTRIFGQEIASNYYKHIKDTYFEGREFTTTTVRDALNAAN